MPIFTESKKVVFTESEKDRDDIRGTKRHKTSRGNVPVEFKNLAIDVKKSIDKFNNRHMQNYSRLGRDLNKKSHDLGTSVFSKFPTRNHYRFNLQYDTSYDSNDMAIRTNKEALAAVSAHFGSIKDTDDDRFKYCYKYSRNGEYIYIAFFDSDKPLYKSNTYKDRSKADSAAMKAALTTIALAAAADSSYSSAAVGGAAASGVAADLAALTTIRVTLYCLDESDEVISLIENTLGIKYSPEEVITPLYEAKKTSYGDFYSNRDNAMKIFNEFMDMSRGDVRRTLIAMGEAEHNQVITKLTSKLYDHIVKKTAEIDFGEIPDTKGDITKLSNYDDLVEVIALLKDIVKEYKQPTDPVDVLSEALVNVKSRKILFDKGFRYNCEFPCLMYNNVVLSIYTGVSFLIATCIEFIKSPKDETFKIALDRVAYAKTKEHILYDSLKKFNETCKSGDFDNAMNLILDKRVKKFTGMAVATIIGASIVGVAIVFNIIPILRELVYCSMYTRVRISDFFETQADLLQMNAYNVEHNATMDPEERRAIAEKQMAIAEKFRYISNKISIEAKRSDVETNKQLQNRQDKFSMEDLEEEIEITPSDSSSALF